MIEKLIFIFDSEGRTLKKESTKRLVSELFEKALPSSNVKAITVTGPSINKLSNFSLQIKDRNLEEWEIVYFPSNNSPPFLVSEDVKERLIDFLPTFNGTSIEAVQNVLEGENYEN